MKLNLAMVLRKLVLTTVKSQLGSGQPRQGHWPEAGLERLIQLMAGCLLCCACHLHPGFPTASVNSFFASLKEKVEMTFYQQPLIF